MRIRKGNLAVRYEAPNQLISPTIRSFFQFHIKFVGCHILQVKLKLSSSILLNFIVSTVQNYKRIHIFSFLRMNWLVLLFAYSERNKTMHINQFICCVATCSTCIARLTYIYLWALQSFGIFQTCSFQKPKTLIFHFIVF